MSNTLNWRTATELHLNDKLIPNPDAGHDLLDKLRNVRVAIDGSFLHIDPRQPNDVEGSRGQEFDVYIVPASVVKTVTYRQKEHRGNLATF